MNKGELMRFAFKGKTTGIDTAIPKEYWSHMDTYWWCTDHRDKAWGELVNLAEVCFKEKRIPQLDFNVEIGEVITIFGLNAFCMTRQMTAKVVEETATTFEFTLEGEKKIHAIEKLNPEIMVFKGYPPFKADSEMKTPEGNQLMRGNCLFNLVTDLERKKLQDWINKNILWPMSQNNMARIVHFGVLENTPNSKIYNDNFVYPLFYSNSQIVIEAKSRERDHVPGL